MGKPNGITTAHLRAPRPTDDLDAVVRYYRDGLGFAVLADFKDHKGSTGDDHRKRVVGRPGVGV
jgi:hypothetical protein